MVEIFQIHIYKIYMKMYMSFFYKAFLINETEMSLVDCPVFLSQQSDSLLEFN